MSDQLFTGEDHAAKYRLYRPSYPKVLYEHIVDYYFNGKISNEKIPLALDVACGSGQATIDLSLFCERVIGIDVSADQIAHAIPKNNIEYHCHTGEDLSFLQSNSIDLITIAVALHWLDLKVFIEEVKRVLKPNTGVFAVWTYAFGNLDNPAADAINSEFYHNVLYPYWNEKQHIVNDYYQSILSLFPYQSTLRQYKIERQIETTIGGLLAFIETASPCQTYRKQNGEQAYQDILNTLRQKLGQAYLNTETDNNSAQSKDLDSIKITISSPIYLYLMKKN
ncbi:unnamed protein product [Rotaria sordida]|uniref:Methyltransferase type 11 domain-containing protein n=1 Tax=Rotaria sordida TaxID=392033 RepID=A0A815GP20_9BILA|nr:unnamed protein product [Rotaria sordida]CAF1512027.1 unnamed protein product [Rotaria sordida]CAF3874441.1 unnamed protein product [Rotaria sordida]CAF3963720.1 unnamed protein product [Rotaria sordida]